MTVTEFKERLALIRYCLKIGTRIKMKTRGCILRPLVLSDLEMAFKEKEAALDTECVKLKEALARYKNGEKPTDPWWADCSSYEDFELLINLNLEPLMNYKVRDNYSVSVQANKSAKVRRFHNSMNPRITFSYSNILLEECDVALNQQIRKKLLQCFADCIEDEFSIRFSYGGCIVDDEIHYEDLEIWKDNKLILSTITHENSFDVDLSEEELTDFSSKRNLL